MTTSTRSRRIFLGSLLALVVVAGGSVSGVGLATAASNTALHVIGSTAAAGGPTALPAGATPRSIVAGERYAYVANRGNNTVSVVDFSYPYIPVVVGTTPAAGTAGGLASGAGVAALALRGSLVYAVNFSTSTLSIIDVSVPTAPVVIGTTPTAGTAGGFNVASGPFALALEGDFAYVVNAGASTFTTVNIASPTAPIVTGSSVAPGTQGGFVSGSIPQSIVVENGRAYVGEHGSGRVSVWDVSSPILPFAIGRTPQAGTPGLLSPGDQPTSVQKAGNYLFVALGSTSGLTPSRRIVVIDVSNPAAPIPVASTPVAGSAGGLPTNANPVQLARTGSFLFSANLEGGNISLIDISNPLAPVVTDTSLDPGALTGLPTGSQPRSITVSGGLLLTSNLGSHTASIYAIPFPTVTPTPTPTLTPKPSTPTATVTTLARTGATESGWWLAGIALVFAGLSGLALTRSRGRRR